MNTQPYGLSGTVAQQNIQTPPKVKYVLYARKSTESEERQVLSIDSQITEMLRMAENEGLEIVDIRRESHSAKDSGQRPVFNEILKDIRSGRFSGILTWAPDRLSRNAGDLGSLVDLMDQKLLAEIRTNGQRFINSPNEKFLLMILCSQAKLENDNKSLNVKRGLRTRCEMGWRPGTALTGYLNEKRTDRKCQVLIDPERAPIVKQMFEKIGNDHWSGNKLYHWLKFDLNFKTRGNKNLSRGNMYRILSNTFYHGVFEYPEGSGNFYNGKHEPLITKDLFDKVQAQLTREPMSRETREFAFTKLLKCGSCGSGISACEKYKKLKDGTVSKYIYYGCTKSRDLNCKGGYIREEDLIKQLIGLIDDVDLNEDGIVKQYKDEVKRYNAFQSRVLKVGGEQSGQKDINVRNYLKYLLRDGTMQERREILSCIKNKIVITKKVLSIEK
jgi:DNA invertase Pin-like site-specific DNA recombinase